MTKSKKIKHLLAEREEAIKMGYGMLVLQINQMLHDLGYSL